MLTHQLRIAQEDMERVDTLRYIWNKLHQQVAVLQTTLLKVQPNFRTHLVENIAIYLEQVKIFTEDYNTASLFYSSGLISLLGTI